MSVVAAEVREIKDITRNDASGKPILTHVIDVIPQAIIPDNPSHAIIDASPAYSNQRVFRRLLERLREIAERRGWMIEPKDE